MNLMKKILKKWTRPGIEHRSLAQQSAMLITTLNCLLCLCETVNGSYFMQEWFCQIRQIHPIGLKFLYFEKTRLLLFASMLTLGEHCPPLAIFKVTNRELSVILDFFVKNLRWTIIIITARWESVSGEVPLFLIVLMFFWDFTRII